MTHRNNDIPHGRLLAVGAIILAVVEKGIEKEV